MKYKIIVDKQSRTNPSDEKREYEVEIEELRCKGNVYDSLVITKDEDYVIRRLSLSEYGILKVLEEPVKQPLENINIELFEGKNYVYLIDMIGNKFYAKYLIKNEFNDLYITERQLTSAITEMAGYIELNVFQKLDEETTGAKIILKINDTTSEVQIEGDKINLKGKVLDFTADEMSIISKNFTVDKTGKIKAINGEIGGFNLSNTEFSTNIQGIYNYNYYDSRNVIAMRRGTLGVIYNDLYDLDEDGELTLIDAQSIIKIILGQEENTKTITGEFKINSNDPKNCISITKDGSLIVSFGVGGINTTLLCAENIVCSTSEEDLMIAMNGTNGTITAKLFDNKSLAEIKKNIKKFGDAVNIIKNSEIYEYNFKTEKDSDKKHIGFVIGDKYKTPNEVISSSGDAIESYTTQSIMWRGLQQVIKRLEKLEEV